MVTMTTVGYGDMTPTTIPGYFAAIIVMILGLVITALPIVVIGGNFAVVHEYNHKLQKKKVKSTKYDS